MSRKPYPTDLTDKEWELLQPLIPPAKTGGRPRTVDTREIVNAILYVKSRGCSWRQLPHDFPPWSTVYDYFRVWHLSGAWKKINQALRQKMQGKTGREEIKSADIVNNQLVKTVEQGVLKRKKNIEEHKNYILVCTITLILMVLVHVAGIQHRDNVKLMSKKSKEMFRSL